MKDLLAALEQQLKQLTQQAKTIDAKQSSWQQKAWFDSDLFQSHSPFLTDYVLEAEAMLKRLKLSSEQKTSSAQALAAKLGAQIQALSRAFQTKDLRYLPGKEKNDRPHPMPLSKLRLWLDSCADLLRSCTNSCLNIRAMSVGYSICWNLNNASYQGAQQILTQTECWPFTPV